MDSTKQHSRHLFLLLIISAVELLLSEIKQQICSY